MRQLLTFGLASLFALLTCQCGSSMQNGQVGADTTNTDAGPDGGQEAFILTIINYNDGCSITEDGSPYRPMSAAVAGTVVALNATPVPGYSWGYWTGTDGDTGSNDANMATTVTMNANKQVVACCPLAPPSAQVCPTPMP
jgi:hypothetical protein